MNLQQMIDRVYAFFASKQSLVRDIRQVKEDMMDARIQHCGDMNEASCNLKRLADERDTYCVAAVDEGIKAAQITAWIRERKEKATEENERLKRENVELYVLLKVAKGIEELKNDKP